MYVRGIVRRQAMKGYLSVREISYKWNVSERWVSKLAQDGRIPGVERFGRSWAVPEDAEKPADPRKAKEQKR
jgi:hypothetical protein